jgi:hypothetical protein
MPLQSKCISLLGMFFFSLLFKAANKTIIEDIPLEILHIIFTTLKQQSDGIIDIIAILQTCKYFYRVARPIYWSGIDLDTKHGRKQWKFINKNLTAVIWVKTLFLDVTAQNTPTTLHNIGKMCNLQRCTLRLHSDKPILLSTILSTMTRLQHLTHLRLTTIRDPVHIPDIMDIDLFFLGKTITHLDIEHIATGGILAACTYFLGGQWKALKTLALKSTRTPEEENTHHIILQSTLPLHYNLTIFYLSFAPVGLNLVALLSGMPCLIRLGIPVLNDIPGIIPDNVIPLLLHFKGPLNLLSGLIGSRNIQTVSYHPQSCSIEEAIRILAIRPLEHVVFQTHPNLVMEHLCALLHCSSLVISCVYVDIYILEFVCTFILISFY